MKLTTLALAAVLIAGTSLARAQEEESAPAPAASPEATTSDPTVSVTTEKSATPAPKPSSSPGATKSASPQPKSSPSPAKSASPSAVMPVKKSTPEATIREIEDKWEASVMAHDPSVAQAYLADDFRGVSSKGKVMSKSDLLSELKKDKDVYTSTKNGKVDVRVFDGKFAVATGISTEVGKTKDGVAFKRSYRWTAAWVERNGKWQCVASQALLVPK
jgi:ketosteroid isomerase-like protein